VTLRKMGRVDWESGERGMGEQSQPGSASPSCWSASTRFRPGCHMTVGAICPRCTKTEMVENTIAWSRSGPDETAPHNRRRLAMGLRRLDRLRPRQLRLSELPIVPGGCGYTGAVIWKTSPSASIAARSRCAPWPATMPFPVVARASASHSPGCVQPPAEAWRDALAAPCLPLQKTSACPCER
jgi:hypothetical protein